MRLSWLAAALLVPGAAFAQPAAPEEPAPAPTPASAPPPPAAPAPAAPAPAGPPGTTAPRGDADADYRRPAPAGRDIVVRTEGERSRNNIITLASVAGAGAVLGAIGLYYNLDAKSAADNVSASENSHIPWSPQLQAQYDQAHSSSVKAGVFYGIGGAVIIGAIVGLIVTTPKSETTVIHPHVGVAPTPGGAVVGGAWSF